MRKSTLTVEEAMAKRSFYFLVKVQPPEGKVRGLWPHLPGDQSHAKIYYWRGSEIKLELSARSYIHQLQIFFLIQDAEGIIRKVEAPIIGWEERKSV